MVRGVPRAYVMGSKVILREGWAQGSAFVTVKEKRVGKRRSCWAGHTDPAFRGGGGGWT